MPTQLAPTVQLIHGSAIPVLGFGTSPLQGAEAATAVRTALETGYRLIDTAENYHNEDAVGRGIRESGLDRAEVFVTSKFNRQWHSVAGVQRAHEASLDRLGLDYLDLLLVHWPNPDQDHYVDAVRGLGELLDSGALRAIGTSNFKPAHLQRVLDETGIVPDVNQIQLNPYTTRQASRAFHTEHQIVTESYSPLGASSDLRSDPVINEVAGNYGKSATQVILRWHIQLGLVPIPKSGNPDRMAENFDVFDFELTDAEMDAITRLDRGENQATDSDVFGH
jgi:2,5-diketo-D-gluconate reductase A